MTAAVTPPAWTADALCAQVDPELFFSEHKGDWAHVKQAKAVCARCPALEACLAWAVETGDQWAVLGGTTAHERRKLRKDAA